MGRFLPAIEYRLEKVEGIGEISDSKLDGKALAGRLFVKGPNVMKGYLNAEANAKFQALGGWYDTGDIARVDGEGFLYILGRLKRFAKISGEMVSLTAVEDALAGAFPHYGLKFAAAVIARPTPRPSAPGPRCAAPARRRLPACPATPQTPAAQEIGRAHV